MRLRTAARKQSSTRPPAGFLLCSAAAGWDCLISPGIRAHKSSGAFSVWPEVLRLRLFKALRLEDGLGRAKPLVEVLQCLSRCLAHGRRFVFEELLEFRDGRYSDFAQLAQGQRGFDACEHALALKCFDE